MGEFLQNLVECQPCREWMAAEDLLNHLRLIHPDIDANPDNTPTTDLTKATRTKPLTTRP